MNITNDNKCNWKSNITRFLIAQTISLFGSSLVQYAIIWYVTLTTSSGKMIMISTICGFLPQILISFFAGVWVDKHNRKSIIMISDGVIALSTLILAVLFLVGFKSIWLVFIVLFIRSAGTGIQSPAVNAIIPQIVPTDALMKVNGINNTLTSLIMFLSPAISGILLSFTTIEATFFVDVITAVIGISITYFIAIQPHIKSAECSNSDLFNLKKGFLYLKETPFIRNLLIFQIVVIFFVSPSAFLTPLLVSRTFGPEVWRLSVSEMTFSLGAALGGLLLAAWGGFKNRFKTTITAGFAYGVIMIMLGLSPLFWVYLFFNMVIGIVLPFYTSPINVLIQEKVDTSMQGRIFSFVHITTASAFPLGMVVFGPLADIVKIQTILIFAGLIVVAATIFALFKNKTQTD